MDIISSRFHMLLNCRFIVSSCARLVFCSTRDPRSFAFANVYKRTWSTLFNFINNSSHLILAWALFRFLEHITMCFDQLKGGPNILLAQDTLNSFRDSFNIWDWGKSCCATRDFWSCFSLFLFACLLYEFCRISIGFQITDNALFFTALLLGTRW